MHSPLAARPPVFRGIYMLDNEASPKVVDKPNPTPNPNSKDTRQWVEGTLAPSTCCTCRVLNAGGTTRRVLLKYSTGGNIHQRTTLLQLSGVSWWDA